MARYIAKNLVAAGLADKCQLELAYAIGVAQPVSVLVDSYGTGKLSDERLGEIVRACFDLRPAAIIKALDLRRPDLSAGRCLRSFRQTRAGPSVGEDGPRAGTACKSVKFGVS